MSASSTVWDRGESEVMLAGQNHVLEMIATQLPLEEILATLVRLIEAPFEGMLCSILLLDEDGLAPVAAGGDMIEPPGKLDAQRSAHAPTILLA